MNWFLRTFDELNTHQLYEILNIRQDVFVVEQNCPYLDADGTDFDAEYLFARNESGKMVAYARIFKASQGCSPSKIGRVLTTADARRLGLGRELMQRAIEYLDSRAPDNPIQVQAQTYLRDFYQSFGFEAISEDYLEDDIPHVDMQRAAKHS